MTFVLDYLFEKTSEEREPVRGTLSESSINANSMLRLFSASADSSIRPEVKGLAVPAYLPNRSVEFDQSMVRRVIGDFKVAESAVRVDVLDELLRHPRQGQMQVDIGADLSQSFGQIVAGFRFNPIQCQDTFQVLLNRLKARPVKLRYQLGSVGEPRADIVTIGSVPERPNKGAIQGALSRCLRYRDLTHHFILN
jgi:hypothetical protein